MTRQERMTRWLVDEKLLGDGCWHEWTTQDPKKLIMRPDTLECHHTNCDVECIKCGLNDRADHHWIREGNVHSFDDLHKHKNPDPFSEDTGPQVVYGKDGLWERWMKDERFTKWFSDNICLHLSMLNPKHLTEFIAIETGFKEGEE